MSKDITRTPGVVSGSASVSPSPRLSRSRLLGHSSSHSKASRSRDRDVSLSPQTSQFNRILDLVTEHEGHSREQDVKIADLSNKVLALTHRLSGVEGATATASKAEGGPFASMSAYEGRGLKEDLSAIKASLDKMNKTVLLLSQENEVTRKRQTVFMDEVQQQVKESQADLALCMREVSNLKNSSRETYKHLKHQCKSFILEHVSSSAQKLKESEEVETAVVKNEISQLEKKLQASNDMLFEKHRHELDKLQDRIQRTCEENAQLKTKVDQLNQSQDTIVESTKAIDSRLGILSSESEKARSSIEQLVKRSEATTKRLSETQHDLLTTQKHLVGRSKDIKQIVKKLGHFMQANQSAYEQHSSNALKSSQLYNSWRNTIFTYNPNYKRDTKSVEDFDSFVRKLKQRLRESEKSASNELGLYKLKQNKSSSHVSDGVENEVSFA